MKTSKMDEDEAWCRKALNRFANWLARLTPERRREAVAKALPCSGPQARRLLAEALIRKLDSKDRRVSDGASDTLIALGPHVASTIEWALITKPTERRLMRLAVVVAAIGRDLSAHDRTQLLMTCIIAAGRAPTPASRAALEAALWELREIEFAAPEEQPDDPPPSSGAAERA